MKIVSKFKDYYDYVGAVNNPGQLYNEKLYLRETVYKAAEIDLRRSYFSMTQGDKIISKWWTENKKIISGEPERFGSASLILCGKAYPFIFLRGRMQLTPGRKGSQIEISRHFNQAAESKPAREKIIGSEDKEEECPNFFKTYFTFEEFMDDITVKNPSKSKWRAFNYNDVKEFYKDFNDRDYTKLHLNLDCPLLLTFFSRRDKYKYWGLNEYEFMCNPNLQELGFMRVMAAETVYQEIDMFLGNILVKDIMPPMHQTDIDKLTAHGFDAKTSFRKPKNK